MNPVYVYPGTFSPPTFGHLNIACQAAALFPELTILCSENTNKKEVWFTPEECQKLWLTYQLPNNVKVMTLPEFKALAIKKNRIVLVRGLRGPQDLEQETAVMLLNEKSFGITKYFYIFGIKKYKNISSSRVRQEINALNFKHLAKSVSPLVISALLEKLLSAKNIFLVVGKTGSGKSTLTKMLNQINPNNYVIITDFFNKQLRPLLQKKFGEANLIEKVLNNKKMARKLIATAWLELLTDSLKQIPANANIFIEIAYGLQPDQLMFNFVGGKILYVGCKDERENFQRIEQRGTPELAGFIKMIPGRAETEQITKKYHLVTSYINTSCSLEELLEKVIKINHLILEKQNDAYSF